MKIVRGTVLSEGVAVGKMIKIEDFETKRKSLGIKKEKENLKNAIQKSVLQLNELKKENREDNEYLDIQKLLIEDYTLTNRAIELIEKGNSAVDSITEILNEYAMELANCHNTYLSLRANDIYDVKTRLLENLIGHKSTKIEEPFILYAFNIRPSFIIQYKNKLLGVVTKKGGYSSHGAILCRQLNIPYMISDIEYKNEIDIILDTRKQQIIIEPTQENIAVYKEAIHLLSLEEYQAIPHPNYGFYANVSDNSELDKVLKYQFDGVGLYRTEMIFMNHDRPYSYEEQYQVYHDAVLKLKEKPICFRTFDIGDDKSLPYIKTIQKGIQNYMDNPILFETQIKALLMANEYNNMRIMFPMISSYTQFVFLRNWVLEIKEKVNPNSKVKIGMMLETKEALDRIKDFKDVDFISVGTNDLVLSIYHIKRNEQKEKMEKYLNNLLLKMKAVVEFCKQNNIFLSICGELAAIPEALKEFMQDGVTNFSVASSAIRVLNKIYKDLH